MEFGFIAEGLEEAAHFVKQEKYSPEKLYSQWWSRGIAKPVETQTPTEYHREKTLRILFQHGSDLIVTDGFQAFKARAGEYLNDNETNIRALRRKNWKSDYWYWYQSEGLEKYPAKTEKVRVYVPTPASVSVQQMTHLLLEALASTSQNYILKCRGDFGVYADCFVLWLPAEDFANFYKVIQIHDFLEFATAPPPLSLPYLRVGLAPDPSAGESFGWSLCQEIWRSTREGTLGELEHNLVTDMNTFWQKMSDYIS